METFTGYQNQSVIMKMLACDKRWHSWRTVLSEIYMVSSKTKLGKGINLSHFVVGFLCSSAISTQKCSSIGNSLVGCLISFLNLDEGIMNIMRHSRLSRRLPCLRSHQIRISNNCSCKNKLPAIPLTRAWLVSVMQLFQFYYSALHATKEKTSVHTMGSCNCIILSCKRNFQSTMSVSVRNIQKREDIIQRNIALGNFRSQKT